MCCMARSGYNAMTLPPWEYPITPHFQDNSSVPNQNNNSGANEPMDVETIIKLIRGFERNHLNRDLAAKELSPPEALAALHHWHNQQAYKEVLELIGEDFVEVTEYDRAINGVKAAQRQTAKERYEQ